MAIQDIIKSRRLELNLNLKDVADALGVAESTVSRYETCNIANMRIDKLKALADILQCTPAYLMGWNESEKPNEKMGELLNQIRRSPQMMQLATDYMQLTPVQQKTILDLVHSMIPDKPL